MQGEPSFLPADQLQSLLDALHKQGYQCTGPTVKDGAIVFQVITSIAQLPRGILDDQQPGQYRLTANNSERYFDWANGPQGLKPLLFPPVETLWSVSRDEKNQLEFSEPVPAIPKIAFIGARSCDLAALKLHDQHFLQGDYVDPGYARRRDNLLVIAVNCRQPASTCFCHSTGDGPFADSGYDIVLTELDAGFLLTAGSLDGEKILTDLTLQSAEPAQLAESRQIEQQARQQQRQLPGMNIKDRLLDELENEAWHEIATRCLACGNCTAVCPSCFCHSEIDRPSLDGASSRHDREWDSCFTQGHSYIHGITIRSQTSQRYRQWLTHKFASWHDQYGRSGCVGCGRCTTWCPVGIDVIASIEQVLERRHD